uniref:Very-short-patch-repair endonuclease n=1 Tax=Siphoviridae sp. ctqw35 TaxID=2826471 RepID=A0A8S5LZZ2_9CAUD|nr:MAG TPA: Very-short-patch-repair endonuclease [Siphoviridae sp. ctqw35]
MKVKCWNCEKTIEVQYKQKDRYFCEECLEKHRKEHKELIEKYTKLKDEVMYENALRLIEKSNTDINKYIDSAKSIKKAMDRQVGTFRSADEIVAAIFLNANELLFEPNKRIGKYITDFFIPELKVCLEVDGSTHKYTTKKDCERDITIRNILGKEWEVVRVKTKYIEKNPEDIVASIISEKMTLQNLRLQNAGIIPESYAKRYRDYYESIGEYTTKKYYK